MNSKPRLQLQDFNYQDLFTSSGLASLDERFLSYLDNKCPESKLALTDYRNNISSLDAVKTSELLIACAIHLEHFIAELFQIEEAVAITQAKTIANNPIAVFKKYFIQRRAKKELKKASELAPFEDINHWLQAELNKSAIKASDPELSTALLACDWLNDPETNKANIDQLAAWCVQAMLSKQGQVLTSGWTSFRLPERLDYQQLVSTETLPDNRLIAPENQWRQRDGFKLTDERMTAREVQDEVNYCVFCHDHEGDFCSKGFPVKKGEPEKGLKQNPLDVTMTGCPLEEKISEMQLLKRDGQTLASLAMVMVDNPMCPATGHRICNDCMKACIYQKQTPVNIPQIETRVLTDVLDLPWGVEIYDLLTRWNPLRQKQWIAKPYNGLKVMIAGMGPAGFTLAHHLLQEGFAVVGFDGLKIEPLSDELINNPVYQFSELEEALDERLMAGFGGVAEYGITVRWDKNFLKLIYMSLMRRPHFQVFGGVRFGGTITVEDAWKMGFDHFAIAVGAGLPKALNIPHSLAPGMRQANDFLMALQLGNAAKASSLNNLQIRLPAVIIGGGLTGVDTATEVQAYYITQVEKTLSRYNKLCQHFGEENILNGIDNASREILNEYLLHGQAIKTEREDAKANNIQPDFIKLIHQWGGVTIAYRRSMQESPAYINNHEELKKALEEGIFYAEGLEPAAVELNEYGHVEVLECNKRVRDEEKNWVTSNETVRLPARAILVATGTQPNTAYEFEHRGSFNRLNLQYQHYEDDNGELSIAHGVKHCKDPEFGPFTSYQKDDKRVSLVGDTHPVFHGSVVKAIASGMRTYPKILSVMGERLKQQGSEQEYQAFAKEMNRLFTARLEKIERRSSDVISLAIRAPLAAEHFHPGQFYRLQNFESYSPHIDHTTLQMEALALVATSCDRKNGILNFIVKENSASAKLCSMLRPEMDVSLMGPTGVRAKIASEHETLLIIGHQASFPFVISYGTSMRQAGNHVILIGLIDDENEVYCSNELAQATDKIIWIKSSENNFKHVNDAIKQHSQIDPSLSISDTDKIYIIGNTQLLRDFQEARKELVKEHFYKDPKVIGSVYGNMQCMLKGVCAQCLQWQIDPETGQRTKAVFACSWQDQPLELIDIDHIDQRKMQNQLLETINSRWVDYLFDEYDIKRV